MRGALRLAALIVLVAPVAWASPAVAAPVGGGDTEAWERVTVKRTGVELSYPKSWVTERPRKIKQGDVRLVAVDNANGDNVSVVVYRDQSWWDGIDEWRNATAQDARTVHGAVLDAARAKVGSMPAYRSTERYKLGGRPVVFGQMDIRRPNGDVVQINTTVDASNAQLVNAILDSVRRA